MGYSHLACSSGMSCHLLAFATLYLLPCHIGLGNDQTRNRAETIAVHRNGLKYVSMVGDYLLARS